MSFQATLGSKPLENFRSAKVQGLLIYLSLTPRRTHARDVLATLFWPDEPEAVAKQNLRQSLFRLRTVLGEVMPIRVRSTGSGPAVSAGNPHHGAIQPG